MENTLQWYANNYFENLFELRFRSESTRPFDIFKKNNKMVTPISLQFSDLTGARDTSVDQIPSMKNKLFIIYYIEYCVYIEFANWNLNPNCTILVTN